MAAESHDFTFFVSIPVCVNSMSHFFAEQNPMGFYYTRSVKTEHFGNSCETEPDLSGILESLGALHVGSERFSWGKCSPQAANGVFFSWFSSFGEMSSNTHRPYVYIYTWLFIYVYNYIWNQKEKVSPNLQRFKIRRCRILN